MIDWTLFFSTYGLIFLAELPDKTAFACLLLGAKNHPMAVFAGVAVAFVVQSEVAVAAGRLLSVFPESWIHLGAGILFLLFAYLLWRERDDADEELKSLPQSRFLKSVTQAFLVIFIAEWGDLTQLATATLAAKYDARWTIFSASVLALWTVAAIGIGLGHSFRGRIRPRTMNSIAAVVFALAGLYFLASAL